MQRFLVPLVLALLSCTVPLAAGAAVMGTVPGSGGQPAVPVYIARPAGPGPFPATVFLHGCDGFDGLIAVAADRLAVRGYVAVAVDSLGLGRPGGACTDPSGTALEASAARTVLAWLRTQPFVQRDHLAVLGFSMGGTAALDLVDPAGTMPPGLRAAVAFYPACAGHDGKVGAPVAIFIGAADQITPSAACTTMAAAATAAGKTLELTVYPGATHGFTVPGPDHTYFGTTVHYDPDATLDSAVRVLQFLNAHVLP